VTDFYGKFRYLEQGGSLLQEGGCLLQFDAQSFTLTPESGAPLSFDLGDIDALAAADWEVHIGLFTGRSLLLRQFGKAYETLTQSLLEAYRERAVRCLLLEDLQELGRFSCQFESTAAGALVRCGPAEVRVYKTNIAVLAATALPFQWRLADIDAVRFDAATYTVILESGDAQLKLAKLGRRTEELSQCLRTAIANMTSAGARALQAAFPFLDPDQLQSVATLLREGGSAPVAQLAAIHPGMPDALAANAVDPDLRPYYDALLARSSDALLYAGFKLIRTDEDPAAGDGANRGEGEVQALYWFFFPLGMAGESAPARVVAWEANSSEGRATYLFRLQDEPIAAGATAPDLNAGVRRLNRGLALLNFRRRPIHLSDDELARDPQHHRYAIAVRRMPELRELRLSFLGRASHTSPAAWLAQIESILAKAV
jgi:hypothetical protein